MQQCTTAHFLLDKQAFPFPLKVKSQSQDGKQWKAPRCQSGKKIKCITEELHNKPQQGTAPALTVWKPKVLCLESNSILFESGNKIIYGNSYLGKRLRKGRENGREVKQQSKLRRESCFRKQNESSTLAFLCWPWTSTGGAAQTCNYLSPRKVKRVDHCWGKMEHCSIHKCHCSFLCLF